MGRHQSTRQEQKAHEQNRDKKSLPLEEDKDSRTQ